MQCPPPIIDDPRYFYTLVDLCGQSKMRLTIIASMFVTVTPDRCCVVTTPPGMVCFRPDAFLSVLSHFGYIYTLHRPSSLPWFLKAHYNRSFGGTVHCGPNLILHIGHGQGVSGVRRTAR